MLAARTDPRAVTALGAIDGGLDGSVASRRSTVARARAPRLFAGGDSWA